jgi:hypothetical protein
VGRVDATVPDTDPDPNPDTVPDSYTDRYANCYIYTKCNSYVDRYTNTVCVARFYFDTDPDSDARRFSGLTTKYADAYANANAHEHNRASSGNSVHRSCSKRGLLNSFFGVGKWMFLGQSHLGSKNPRNRH